jgi:hypothetical protein
MKREETSERLDPGTEDEIDAGAVAMMKLLERLDTDLRVGIQLFLSRNAEDRVTGASISVGAQRAELEKRAHKHIEILGRLERQLAEIRTSLVHP